MNLEQVRRGVKESEAGEVVVDDRSQGVTMRRKRSGSSGVTRRLLSWRRTGGGRARGELLLITCEVSKLSALSTATATCAATPGMNEFGIRDALRRKTAKPMAPRRRCAVLAEGGQRRSHTHAKRCMNPGSGILLRCRLRRMVVVFARPSRKDDRPTGFSLPVLGSVGCGFEMCNA